MDEEDLAELRENQVKSGIQEKMDLLGGTQAELGRLGGTGDEEEECATSPHLTCYILIFCPGNTAAL